MNTQSTNQSKPRTTTGCNVGHTLGLRATHHRLTQHSPGPESEGARVSDVSEDPLSIYRGNDGVTTAQVSLIICR